MGASARFGADAENYDRSRRQLIPCFDDFYRIAVEQSPFPADAAIDVLDLGAGTGLLTSFFATAYPHARFTLVDGAPEMLAKARARFGDDARMRYVVADYAASPIDGMYDLIVSCLSIHHLQHADKRALFARALSALKPGGAFINADEVSGATPATDAHNLEAWQEAARRLGASQEDLDASRARMEAFDILATLPDQLDWLEDAGFRDVDCAYKNYMFAVYSGRKHP
jgi:tRNA (cmo5U34)-methyltransferase